MRISYRRTMKRSKQGSSCGSEETAERDLEIALTKQRDKMLRDFLALLDDLERAMAPSHQRVSIRMRLQGTKRACSACLRGINALKQYGVVRFDSLGEIFDPERHEAMRRESHVDYDVNHVCAVFQTGYFGWGPITQGCSSQCLERTFDLTCYPMSS